jgi:FkbM family methyltransferase
MNNSNSKNYLTHSSIQIGRKSIINNLKKIAKFILPNDLIERLKYSDLFERQAIKSYSQYGEDTILKTVFEDRKTGFYVDVGAHDPKICSNTYFFYKKGWSGINLDAMPGSMNLFNKIRPRDINLEIAIADKRQEMTFFEFSQPLFNSLDENLSRQRERAGIGEIIKEEKISTKTLEEILKIYLPKNQKINFLSVDVEGLDLQVLHSNNWELFRPEYILAECLYWNFDRIHNNEIYQFLSEKGYIFFAKTIYTVIFVAIELAEQHRQRGIIG